MKKYNLIFTLDYEIHGNGDGSPYKLMVEPTERLMNLLEKYGAKLTILADIAEILCFKKYFEETSEDKFHYKAIEKQLQETVQRGHDVQLHCHSSYFKANFDGKKWLQNWQEYNMATLSCERIGELVKSGVDLLENIISPIKPNYKCTVFRAANWSMMPTENIYKSLINNKIKIDTSVYKGGVQGGNVCYDYREAYSNIENYPASSQNINHYDKDGQLTEYPIYTEMRPFWHFISPLRIFRMVRAKFHKHNKNTTEFSDTQSQVKEDNRKLSLKSFFRKSPWKLDFNQASGFQMISALKRIQKLDIQKNNIPVVLIGHSKTFVPYNEKTLEKFLKWTKKQKNIEFGLFPQN
jgi:hypothetical protein